MVERLPVLSNLGGILLLLLIKGMLQTVSHESFDVCVHLLRKLAHLSCVQVLDKVEYFVSLSQLKRHGMTGK